MRILQRSPIYSHPDRNQVYSPAEDSFLLLKAAEQEIRSEDRVLEVGVGSGYVASHLPSCRQIIGTDCNPHAVRITQTTGISVIRTDLTSGLRGPFDLILFNPPYLPTSAEEQIDDWLEYALDGGITGREVIERFLSEVPLLLSPEGRILLLISSLNGFEETKKLIRSTGWDCKVTNQEVVEGGEVLLVCRLVRSLSDEMKKNIRF